LLIELANLRPKPVEVGFEIGELDPRDLALVVSVVWPDGAVVSVIVPQDRVGITGMVELKPVGVTTWYRRILDGKQFDPGTGGCIELEVAFDDDITVGHTIRRIYCITRYVIEVSVNTSIDRSSSVPTMTAVKPVIGSNESGPTIR
jgi:hypothetical protein